MVKFTVRLLYTCSICQSPFPIGDGFQCSCKFFNCWGCIECYCESTSGESVVGIASQTGSDQDEMNLGRLRCTNPKCRDVYNPFKMVRAPETVLCSLENL